ncbi:MAG: TIGR03364 family FAD-dependent oxidoreductase [Planctomycetes bacterium]|nr:TIGR03364 family FAD-dependent oxidoreductase [Planctomycetota bacterium]
MASEQDSFDVVIVGAGIQGLAQALSAAKRGHRVLVLERTKRALGASVRNFGMIWPIGQPLGVRLELALASRRCWLEFARAAKLPLRECGSLFVATQDDETEAMESFVNTMQGSGLELRFLSRTECKRASPLVREDRVIGGMSSDTEANIDPWHALACLAHWLEESHGVRFSFQEAVTHVETDRVETSRARSIRTSRTIVCEGLTATKLFPEAFDDASLLPCRLQMLRTAPLGSDMGPMLATGLTLRHYPSFALGIARAEDSGLAAFDRRIRSELPALDRFGIHVMVSQDHEGRLVLGDSHVYGDAALEPFRSERIDELVLAELDARFSIRALRIEERWQGRYLKRTGHGVFVHDPMRNVRIVNGLGGNGMTLSFGIAETMWNDWSDADLLSGLADPEPLEGTAPRIESRGELHDDLHTQPGRTFTT